MKTIYKYPMRGVGINELNLPVGAKILTAQMQGDALMVWALVDDHPDRLTDPRTFYVLGTGWNAEMLYRENEEDIATYLATVQQKDGFVGFVWHVFYR